MMRISPRPALRAPISFHWNGGEARRQAGPVAACRQDHPVLSWRQWCRAGFPYAGGFARQAAVLVMPWARSVPGRW